MQPYLLVALGSAIGGVCRFWLGSRFDTTDPASGFYWGTLAINAVGCLVIGAAAAASDAAWVRQLVMAGLLGGFTTFSAFSLHALKLAQAERWGAAALYVGMSMVVCLLAVWAGWSVVRGLGSVIRA